MKHTVKYRPCSKVVAAKSPWQVSDLIKEIHDTIYNVASKELKAEGWDMSDIAHYFVVDVSEAEPGVIRAEIRGELEYEQLSELCSQLDKVIAVKFDKDAYFEPVEPGIAEAFIRTKVEASCDVNASGNAKTRKGYITHYGDFDNGHVWHDSKRMTEDEFQEAARQASLKDPTNAYYVYYVDSIMNDTSGIVWVNGVAYRDGDVSQRGDGIVIDEDAQPIEMSTEIKAYTFDEAEDGWGEDVENILSPVFARAEDLMYEIRNTVRGANTDCETTEDLADFIRELASEFEEAADEIESL